MGARKFKRRSKSAILPRKQTRVIGPRAWHLETTNLRYFLHPDELRSHAAGGCALTHFPLNVMARRWSMVEWVPTDLQPWEEDS